MKKNINITEAEYEKLKAEFGDEDADEIIEEASMLKEKNNIESVSDFAFVLKIAREASALEEVHSYFRFPDTFFNDFEIIRMQNLPGNMGYEFLVILLKLYCRSTKQGGYLKIRTASSGGIDYEVIGSAIRHKDVNTVKAAIAYFLEVGLVEVTEDVDYTTFLVPRVKNNVGK